MKTLIFSLALLSIAITVRGQGQCDMTIDDLDKCAQQVSLFGNRNFIVPSNDAELDKFCSDSKAAFQCMNKYVRKCMNPFAQTLFGTMQVDAKKIHATRCVDPEGRKLYLKHMKCGIPKSNFEPLHVCVDNYVAQIDWLTGAKLNREDQMAALCCSSVKLHKCMIGKTGEVCDSITGPETKEYFDKAISAAMSESMDLSCAKYRNYDMCKANLKPEIWEPLRKIGEDARKEHRESRFHSPITVLMGLFSKLS